jgi:cytochrome bd ubiquinol oxidase subunit I
VTDLDAHRLHFAFTIIYHYIYPQLTMGLALLIVVLKTMALRGDVRADGAVGFWAKLFGVAFVMGVVTGIPMEFQFGTNWSRFSAYAGGIIGQTLAMEGVFAFFLESSFVYFMIFGHRRLSPRLHWTACALACMGTWASGFFIVCTNAWMQHPVAYEALADGTIRLTSVLGLLGNPWAWAEYVHTMVGAVITGSVVMASVGAFYILRGAYVATARRFLGVAVVFGAIASVLAAFPTGDAQAKLVYENQPVTFAAMEGHFHTEQGAALAMIGQPDVQAMRLDNPIVLPHMLSLLTHKRWTSRIDGLADFDRQTWPTNIPLLYYAYHIMVGLGTIFIAVMLLALFFLVRGTLHERRGVLWALMFMLPFPFIANTAGWMTAELGRQPWIVHGLLHTADGSSQQVSAGNALFTLLGFMGLYAMLSVLVILLVSRIIARGPEPLAGDQERAA